MTQFSQRLAEKRIMVTRPKCQTEHITQLFTELGATVFWQPTIKIVPVQNSDVVCRTICDINSYDFLVFASSNGVANFISICEKLTPGIKISGLSCQFVATGPKTAEQLRQNNVSNIIIPFCEQYHAEGIIERLQVENIAGKRFLLIRGDKGRDVLPKELEKLGGNVTQISVYQSVFVKSPDQEIASLLISGKIDWTTVTSSAIAVALARMFGECLKKTKLVSISPITSETLSQLGFAPHAEAVNATMPALVDAVVRFENDSTAQSTK